MSNNTKTRLIKPMRTRDDLGKWDVKNSTGAQIDKGSVLRVTGTVTSGAYHTVVKAIADGTQVRGQLLMLWADLPDDTVSISSERRLIEMDTSSATVSDLVYLSDTVAGALTLLVSSEPVGRVHTVSTTGWVWIDPKWTLASTSAADLDGYRPDVDLTWEATIASGDGTVHVDGATGNDTTGNGTPTLPYLTIGAAILDIPHNRTATALRAVTINLDQPGLSYTLPSHLEAASLITIKGALPTASETGDVTVVNSTTTAAGMWLDTDIAYTSEKLTGFLVKYPSGKYGQVVATYDDGGGFCSIFATQNVNGAVYDTSLVSDTLEFWDPTDLCTVASANTGGNGTNFSQMDNFKINFCRLSSVGGSGKLVFYQSRATLQNCNVGPDIGRVYVNNGSLTLNNCYIETEGESKEFAMVSAGAHGLIQLRGGTVFNGTTAGANNYPLSATGNARLLTAGPIMFRLCQGVSLSNGAQIDFADGYDAEVSWFFTEQDAGAPFVTVDLFDGGAPVTGTIPDIHGDPLTLDHIVEANAPCQLWLGQGTDVNAQPTSLVKSTTPVSVNGGASIVAGNAYDGSFVRRNRARSSATLGTNWGPITVTKTSLAGKTSDLVVDWMDGTSQTWDLSAASNDTSGTVDWYFDNATVGAWHTLVLELPVTLAHDWTNIPVLWAGGTAPTLSAGSGDIDVLRFYYTGSSWIGESVALDVQ